MPDLLMAKIPENVPNWMAAYSTVLSIAMQALGREMLNWVSRCL
jgi:hypothetical protein